MEVSVESVCAENGCWQGRVRDLVQKMLESRWQLLSSYFVPHPSRGGEGIVYLIFSRAAAADGPNAADLLQEAVQTDGGHHKQWYLEQIAARLGVDLPEHDPGIPD